MCQPATAQKLLRSRYLLPATGYRLFLSSFSPTVPKCCPNIPHDFPANNPKESWPSNSSDLVF